jgi:hypothetical protein
MPTAAEVLIAILPEWRALLQGWSASGQLAAAANEALLLTGNSTAEQQLQQLCAEWASGDFQGIPEIVLLTAGQMNGAMGAYATSTGKIYLNADWLSSVGKDQIIGVLNEELGHSLDALLNSADTLGDEGEAFSHLLLRQSGSTEDNQASAYPDDAGTIIADGVSISVEQAAITPSYSIASLFTGGTSTMHVNASILNSNYSLSYVQPGGNGQFKVVPLQGLNIDLSALSISGDYFVISCDIKPAANGDLVAMWSYNRGGIYAQVFDSSGSPKTGILALSTTTRGERYMLNTLESGGCIVTGGSTISSTSLKSWYIDGSTPVRNTFDIAQQVYSATDAAALGSGSVVTLMQGSMTSQNYGMTLIQSTKDGQNISLYLSLNDGGGANISRLSDGRVAWTYRAYVGGSGYSCYARIINTDGTLSAPVAISPSSSRDSYGIAADNIGGGFWVYQQAGASFVSIYHYSANLSRTPGPSVIPSGDIVFADESGITIANKQSNQIIKYDSAGNIVISQSLDLSLFGQSDIRVNMLVNGGQGTLSAITGNGAFTEGVTLTAGSVTGDPDGAATATTYQWYLNGNAIASATASTYTVGPQGAGSYTVAVSYTDAQGFSATLTSAAQVVSPVNNGNGILSAITGNGAFHEGVTLSAGSISGDPDGAATATTYQWYLNGNAIASANASTYTVGPQGAGSYTVAVSYTDAQGFSATLTSAAQVVTAVNNGNGTLSAITSSIPGVFQEGVTLTAGAVTGDPDGAATATTYQWYLNGNAIASANASTYTVGPQGAGSYTVAVSYTDAQGFSATLTSAAQVVTAVNNGNGTLSAITGNGVFQEGVTLSAGTVTGDPDGNGSTTGYQWYFNDAILTGATSASYTTSATGTGNYKVAVTYRDGQSNSTTLTSANQAVAKIDNGQGILTISGTTVVGATLTASSISGDPEGLAATPNITYSWYRNGTLITGDTTSSYLLVAADAGTKISVKASYQDGQSYLATATSAETSTVSQPADSTAPVVTDITVEGLNLRLTFSEAIKGSSLSVEAYKVLVAGVNRPISGIAFDGTANNRLLLTLSGTAAPTALQTLTVAYTSPAGNPQTGVVTDLAGNPLPTFQARAVDTFVSGATIGSASKPLQANYIGATLTGGSAIDVYANSQNNRINGNAGANKLYGYLGNDQIQGGRGADSLYGGGGIDTLTGGLAADSFYLDVKPTTLTASSVDRITDFNAAEADRIIFSRRSFGFSSTSVSLATISSSSQLAAALATTSVFVYDSSTGYLHWNQNGSTAGAGTGGIVAALESYGGAFPFLAASNLSIA